MSNKVIIGNCLEACEQIKDKSINLILTDLPYGTTRNKWDVVIPFDPLWDQINRVKAHTAPVLLFGMGAFSAKTILSNETDYKYSWIWEKTMATGHLNAKRMPMKAHEDINVFYSSQCLYNPQKTQGHERKVSTAHHKRNSKKTTNWNSFENTGYDSTERYPRTVLKFKSDKQKNPLHPTQKPVELLKYFILTYTNPGDTVLDLTAGSGSTGEAAAELDRKFICIDNDPHWIEVMHQRLKKYL